ncbi:MAG: hypothetical protein QXH07_06120 [Thermoplasmata archaeon]
MATESFSQIINANMNLILFLVFIIVVIILVWAFFKYRHHRKSDVNINVNSNSASTAEAPEYKEGEPVHARLDKEFLDKVFGTYRKIKDALIGIGFAIPFYVIGYIIGTWLVFIAIPITIFIMLMVAKYWYKPEGVELILDGDIFPEEPEKGVQHYHIFVPLEQWKYIVFTDPGGANPILMPSGMGYRIEAITFMDENKKVIDTVTFSWMHANDANFEQKHVTFHITIAMLKSAMKEVNLLKYLMQIHSMLQARDMTNENERIKMIARTNPSKAQSQIDKITREIEVEEKEIKKLQRRGYENPEKVAEELENGNSSTESGSEGGSE